MKKRLVHIMIVTAMAVVLLLALASCEASDNAMKEEIFDSESVGNNGVNVDFGGTKDEAFTETEYQRKIIKTANVSAETKEFDKALGLIEELCERAGGYIEKSSMRGQSLDSEYSRRYADYTLRIPSENFDGFNEGLGSILNVVSSSSNADEVTSAYYDIKSRIEVLQMQKDALQEMYDNYTNYKDIDSLIALQDKLFSVIEEIEAYETQIRLYDDRVAYSTVHLSVSEVVIYTEDEEQATFGQRIALAFSGGWKVFVSICQGIAIAFVACFPTLAAMGIIAAVIALICIRSTKRARAKKQNQQVNLSLQNENKTE